LFATFPDQKSDTSMKNALQGCLATLRREASVGFGEFFSRSGRFQDF